MTFWLFCNVSLEVPSKTNDLRDAQNKGTLSFCNILACWDELLELGSRSWVRPDAGWRNCPATGPPGLRRRPKPRQHGHFGEAKAAISSALKTFQVLLPGLLSGLQVWSEPTSNVRR